MFNQYEHGRFLGRKDAHERQGTSEKKPKGRFWIDGNPNALERTLKKIGEIITPILYDVEELEIIVKTIRTDGGYEHEVRHTGSFTLEDYAYLVKTMKESNTILLDERQDKNSCEFSQTTTHSMFNPFGLSYRKK
ncbi:MAG: hypothetical protein QGF74_01915 [Candidatus Nanoarchaeia archaeon]|jgi:hypothetical protein|nr:hypothetical protein [Candidatus Nanoarchaeia archaeon]|tara:strand:+ start:31343 stop:31747 length:405 start_codon:yes stop_codon:yes gene_type:complete